jgi:alkylated DNA nucleotide flippase Atl1
MPTIRAEAVAEVLWELKKMEKLATFSAVAERAGFKAGPGGKNIETCLEAVKREWPHLQWWRAVKDDGKLPAESDQATLLSENGYGLEPAAGRKTIMQVIDLETHLYSWSFEPEPA